MLPAMAGTVALTIVMSRISMKLDTPMAMDSSTSALPRSGGYSPGGSGLVAASASAIRQRRPALARMMASAAAFAADMSWA